MNFRPATPEDAERLDRDGFAPIIGQVTSRELTALHRVITCACGPACPRPGQHPRNHSFASTAEALRRQLAGSNLLCDPTRLSLVILKPITPEGLATLGAAAAREDGPPCWEIPTGPFKGSYFAFRGVLPAHSVEIGGLLVVGRDHPPFPLPPCDLGQEPGVVEKFREGQNVFVRVLEGAHHVVQWSRKPGGLIKPHDLPIMVAEVLANAVQEQSNRTESKKRRASA